MYANNCFREKYPEGGILVDVDLIETNAYKISVSIRADHENGLLTRTAGFVSGMESIEQKKKEITQILLNNQIIKRHTDWLKILTR